MAQESTRSDLKDLLLREGVVTLDQMNEALREQEKTKEPLLEIFFRLGKVDDKKIASVLSHQMNYTAVNLAVFALDPSILKLIPKTLVEKYTALPVSQFENTLTVAFANPFNLKALDEIHAITGLRIKSAVAPCAVIKKYIAKYYNAGTPAATEYGNPEEHQAGELDEIVKMIETEQEADKGTQASELMKVAFETPIIKLVNTILMEGIRRKASDIFIEPWERFVRVRVRVDGLLEEIIRPPKVHGPAIVSRIKIMSELDIAEHRIPQDGRFKVKVGEREVDMRVSILPTTFGEKVCLRILDTKSQSHDISKLGFSEKEQQIIKDSAQKPHGMILVTGPTGSGKTTTLYSVLKYLDKPTVNITTVEDPVEYQIFGINQVNIKENFGLTFPLALRSILRQDPDICLVGEIRDYETLDIAVKAAMTGHLVLSTLHTNDAASSITRMVNMGLEPFLISSTVLMISAQRLVRRVCPRCKQAEEMNREVLVKMGIDPGVFGHTFYKGKGCSECRQSGYKGRSVITEILQISPEARELIMEGKSAEYIKAVAHASGMSTLRECALRKAAAGDTSLEEVFRVTSEDQGLDKAESKAPKKSEKMGAKAA